MTTYKRSQIEDSICRLNVSTGAVRSKLLVRIKRLLDIDRALERTRPPKGRPGRGYAFFSEDPPGIGQENLFQEYEGFALTLALQFLDQGVPHQDVVEILRHLRPALESEHKVILAQPFEYFAKFDESKRSNEPTQSEHPVFIAIGRLTNKPKTFQSSSGLTAEILHGLEDWWTHFWASKARTMTTTEITLRAHAFHSQLLNTKPRKKGRP